MKKIKPHKENVYFLKDGYFKLIYMNANDHCIYKINKKGVGNLLFESYKNTNHKHYNFINGIEIHCVYQLDEKEVFLELL